MRVRQAQINQKGIGLIMRKITKLVSILVIALMLSACGSEPPSPTADFQTEPVTKATEAPTIPGVTIPNLTAEHSTEATETTTEAPTASGDVDLSKVIAITFDDGPDMRYTSSTERILDVLEKYNCKATFFVQGVQLTYKEICDETTGQSFAERNKALVAREHELGMEIGSHSYDHPNFNNMSASEIQAQVEKSCSMIEEITGEEVKIIRTPYGAEKQNVLDAIDMPIIIWDIDTLDWDTKDPDNTYKVIMEQVKGGSIILMHDIYGTTADAVEMVVPDLVAKGYKLVTISEMFRLYGTPLSAHHSYYNAR